MAAYVKKIQKYSITLGVGTSSVSTPLASGTVGANCVPYITKRVTTAPTTADDFRELNVDAYMDTSTPPNVIVETTASVSRALVVEISVVEYDGTIIAVEQVGFTLDDLALSKGDIPYSTPGGFANYVTKAFLYMTYRSTGTAFNYGTQNLAARFVSTTLIEVERGSNAAGSGAIIGHLYVIKDMGVQNVFTAQYQNISIVNGASSQNSTALTSITENKTFLIGSHLSLAGTDDAANGTVDAKLLFVDPDYFINVQRVGTTNTLTWRGKAITFAGSAELVQRGTLTQTSAVPDQDVTFTTPVNVTYADSIARIAGCSGSISSGSFNGTADAEVSQASCALNFSDTIKDTIKFRHLASTVTDVDMSWEVIKFDVEAPAATRRIFIIS